MSLLLRLYIGLKSNQSLSYHRGQLEDEQAGENSPQLCDHRIMPGSCPIYAARGLAEACKFVYNDAKFVNERARNDIILLSRYYSKL